MYYWDPLGTDLDIIGTNLVCSQEEHIMPDLCKSLESIDYDNNQFSFFDFGLSVDDIATLSKIDMSNFEFFTIYSDIEELAHKIESFTDSLHEDNNVVNYISSLIFKISNNIIKASGFDAAKITFIYYQNLVYHEDSIYWHLDKTAFEYLKICPISGKDRPRHIFIIPLIGDTTLFKDITQEQREIFNKYADHSSAAFGYFHNSERLPKEIRNLFDNIGVQKPTVGQGSIHFAGMKHGTIHATPIPNNKDRFIMIISPDERWIIKNLESIS